MTDNICHSGGAAGADRCFEDCASRLGHRVIHYTFPGHEISVRPQSDAIHRKLTLFQLREADQFLLRANASLQREFPCRIEYSDNLLRRSWWIIRNVDVVYAVCRLDVKRQQVTGSAAFAIQCLIDRARESEQNLQAFLFDQQRQRWYRFDLACDIWKTVSPRHVPMPHGNYAAIGTSKLTERGSQAIEGLFGLSPSHRPIHDQ